MALEEQTKISAIEPQQYDNQGDIDFSSQETESFTNPIDEPEPPPQQTTQLEEDPQKNRWEKLGVTPERIMRSGRLIK